MFHSFLSDDSKQDTATNTAHSKHFIKILKEIKMLTSSLSKIWDNTDGEEDGCAEQYRCASALYLMSVMSQYYSVIIYCGISSPVNGKEVVDSINAIYKHYIYQLMSNVQLPGSKTFDSQILMHSCTQQNDVSMAKEFQKNLSK